MKQGETGTGNDRSHSWLPMKDKIALVTGASSGIGAATARALAGAGATVIVTARRLDRLEALAEEIGRAGGTAVAYKADVGSEDEISGLFRFIRTRFGRLDLLVNNAGTGKPVPTDEMTLAQWKEIIDIDLTAVFLCSREAFRIMKAQKSGRMISIGSISAKVPRPHSIAYASAKAALTALTHSLALDGREHGITATVLHPGSTLSELTPGMSERPATLIMATDQVAHMIMTIASLPDEILVLETVMLPIAQPFLGRG